MKFLLLYPYPPEPDGLSLQGDLLCRGLSENKEATLPCHLSSEFQKEWAYRYFKPDVAIGVGYWGHTPDIIEHPRRFGITPVPWFVADGWVANYHNEIESLPLVLTTSDWVKKTYARDGVDTKRFITMPIGFDVELFRPIPRTDSRVRAIRDLLKISENEVMILTVGGDVTSKGAQEIFRALKLIGADAPPWKYVCKIWGGESADDHYDDEMALIEALGPAKDNVIYLEGSLSPDFMPYLLSAADIYAAPSRLEGFGMVQVEAQACGIPVISINHMGPKETVRHGETGFLANVAKTVELESELVYPHMGFEEEHRVYFDKPKTFAYRADVNELAEYLVRLIKDKKLRVEMGRRGREHVVKNFEYRNIAKRIADITRERLALQ